MAEQEPVQNKFKSEKQIIVVNGCPNVDQCVFAQFLAFKERFNEEGNIDCGRKNPKKCPRNPKNPHAWIPIDAMPTSYEELEIAFPNGTYG